jgi:cysteine dioxygenase
MDTLPSSLQEIVKFFEHNQELSPAKVEDAIRRAQVKEEDLAPWTDFDHPLEDGYGRKMVHKSDDFEIMVMSWNPGDFSAIHDHGNTQYGAVQIFGEADHAIFSIADDHMVTTSRWLTSTGDTVPVNHDLIHQMGNPGDKPFISLHVYGTTMQTAYVTGEARLYDIQNGIINLSNGGAFFSLPEDQVVKRLHGVKGDFLTTLRYGTEFCYQQLKAGVEQEQVRHLLNTIFDTSNKSAILKLLDDIVDQTSGKIINQRKWQTLQLELRAHARLLEKLRESSDKTDPFDEYAPLYDAIIGYNSFDFQKGYIDHFFQFTGLDPKQISLLSVGCGTGMVESWICDHFDLPHDQLLGIDVAASMVRVAKKRIKASVQDVLTYAPGRGYDVVFTGLNVLQYLSEDVFEQAVSKMAELTNVNGYFIGDFITPDHIEWYPNLMTSENRDVFSFRSPRIVESEPYDKQESEIINLSFLTGEMHVYHAGRHLRILPSIAQVVTLFERYFHSTATVLDAVSLQPIDKGAMTCNSTRYVIIVKKEKDR